MQNLYVRGLYGHGFLYFWHGESNSFRLRGRVSCHQSDAVFVSGQHTNPRPAQKRCCVGLCETARIFRASHL